MYVTRYLRKCLKSLVASHPWPHSVLEYHDMALILFLNLTNKRVFDFKCKKTKRKRKCN